MQTTQITKPRIEIPEMTEEKRQAAKRLIQSWVEDTSGYDAQVWPAVKQSIEENRTSNRERFGE